MTDTLGTVWPLEPHTEAKHKILRGYLNAWFTILDRRKKVARLLYVDGFAGPGVYSGGEDGSPVIALKALEENPHGFTNKVNAVFIEKDAARFARLEQVVKPHRERLMELKRPVEIILSPRDCEAELGAALDAYARKKLAFGPALIFLDQFGYSDVPLSLVERIMKHDGCEVLSYLSIDGIRRFLDDTTKHGAISKAFGGETWQPALKLRADDRVRFLAAEYQRQLKTTAGAKFVWQFAMHGEGNKLLYWLFFATNSDRGLEEMKKAMMKVDDSGGSFRFSDATVRAQALMFSAYTDAYLMDDVAKQFAGKEVTVGAVRLFVLEGTPLVNFKTALQKLESDGRLSIVNPPKGRRKGTFPDEGLRLAFALA